MAGGRLLRPMRAAWSALLTVEADARGACAGGRGVAAAGDARAAEGRHHRHRAPDTAGETVGNDASRMPIRSIHMGTSCYGKSAG